MKKLLFGALILLTIFNFYSCNIINPDEPLPNYITIDSFDLVSTDPNFHGSVSENISDVWVYVDNHNAGNFQLPATIPILIDQDSVDLLIFAGIKNNGQSLSRRRYPFYVPYTQRLGKSLAPQNIIPKIEYRTNANFLLNEDFENGNSFIPYTSPDTGLDRSNLSQYVFEGSYSGLIYLDGTNRGARVITAQNFAIPSNKESYLEIDYKSDIPFSVELQLLTNTNSVLVSTLLNIKTRIDWNKIYINLTDIGSLYPGNKVNIILRTALSPDKSTGFVAVDNIKVVTQ